MNDKSSSFSPKGRESVSRIRESEESITSDAPGQEHSYAILRIDRNPRNWPRYASVKFVRRLAPESST
jgi:hypothetical protein